MVSTAPLIFKKSMGISVLPHITLALQYSIVLLLSIKLNLFWCMLYIFFSGRRAATNYHPDFNLMFYLFRPSPIHLKHKAFGAKCDRCSDWSPPLRHFKRIMQHCTTGLAKVDTCLSNTGSDTGSGAPRVNTPTQPLSASFAIHRSRAVLVWTHYNT